MDHINHENGRSVELESMNSFEKINIVGRGAYGAVHLCKWRRHGGKCVILKEIPMEVLNNKEDDVESTLNECTVLAMLQHPNIIQYYESFRTSSALMIVMEYAPGGTLRQLINERHGNLGEEKDVVYLFSQIVLGLNHMHSHKIIHRDLKTENLFLNASRQIVKIGDFGISKILHSKTNAVTVVGTPSYMSPELCEGRQYNEKSDMWALGCILYELITSQLAFEARTFPNLILKIMRGHVREIPSQYSMCLRSLVTSLIHLDPSKRPSTTELLENPVLCNEVANLYTDLGSVGCPSRSFSHMLFPGLNDSIQRFKEIIHPG